MGEISPHNYAVLRPIHGQYQEFVGFRLERDRLSDPRESLTAREVAKGVDPLAYQASILLYGEPGTGKTALAYWVAGAKGSRRLRVPASTLLEANSLADAIVFLRPDVVIVDDIDRAERPAAMLEQFDELRAVAPCIVATANSTKFVDGAVLRRFTSVHKVDVLDESTRTRLTTKLPEEVRKAVWELPIDYLRGVVAAYEQHGLEAARERARELIRRRAMVLHNESDRTGVSTYDATLHEVIETMDPSEVWDNQKQAWVPRRRHLDRAEP